MVTMSPLSPTDVVPIADLILSLVKPVNSVWLARTPYQAHQPV